MVFHAGGCYNIFGSVKNTDKNLPAEECKMRNPALASARNSLVTKIITPLLLTTAMFLCVLAAPAQAVSSTYDMSWYVGHESDTAFKISTDEQLAGLARIVNNNTDNFSGDTITLSASIDLSDYPDWTPIGSDSYPFMGTFNGNGKTVKGLSAHYSSGTSYGLFGIIGNSGRVQNLKLEIADITASTSVGGIAGVNWGEVTKCTVTVSGAISGSVNIGGIAGENRGTVSDCTVSGGGYIGGIGANYVGGLVGYNFSGATLKGSAVKIGNITGASAATGALAGYNAGNVNNNGVDNTVKINNSPVDESRYVGLNHEYGKVSNNSIIDPNAPQDGGGGGCDAGFGFGGIAAIGAGAVIHRKKRQRI
jgi:hypothetical protein